MQRLMGENSMPITLAARHTPSFPLSVSIYSANLSHFFFTTTQSVITYENAVHIRRKSVSLRRKALSRARKSVSPTRKRCFMPRKALSLFGSLFRTHGRSSPGLGRTFRARRSLFSSLGSLSRRFPSPFRRQRTLFCRHGTLLRDLRTRSR